MRRLKSFEKLTPSYLFPEIERRKEQFLKRSPDAEIINLGIGDTVRPLPPPIAEAMERASHNLALEEGYSGYGKTEGLLSLREALSTKIYHGNIAPDEIFISDGAKCDTSRLQILLQRARSVGVQDPSYPIYLDGTILHGIKEIHALSCTPENGFFPTLPKDLDLLYICNPNNPTGTAYTTEQLKRLVDYAHKVGALILYDGAYSSFIQDPDLPKSIYDIEGARHLAIEVNSFSKMVGFTGVRLGWTVIPKELKFECGHSLWSDWKRLISIAFNGASNIAQRGGLAVFEGEEWRENLLYYMENARLLKAAFEELGYDVYGGEHAPFLWIHSPGESSWDLFQYFLERRHIVITPGIGFGAAGEHFIRVSSFAHRDQINAVIHRIEQRDGASLTP
ncbi:MAG: LL-diaminopimelate aminotransferase [Chlamydiae bacterium]|nr:LL-diaminopimelate aminotransferase [Chlamydiota bacterium]